MPNFNIYKASAGSGKTYTLVKEYIKKALSSQENVSHKSLLAITFTNKAASEMKTRIITTLFNFSNGNKIDFFDVLRNELNFSNSEMISKSSKVLSDIIHYYGFFSVSTIDKFLHKIIRSFTYELDLPSNFEIELDANNLIEEGVYAVLDEMGSNDKLTKSLLNFSKHKIINDKSWNIETDLKLVGQELVKDNKLLFIHRITNVVQIQKHQNLLQNQIIFFESKIKKIYTEISDLIKVVPSSSFRYQDLPNYLNRIKDRQYKKSGIEIESRLYNSIINNNWYSQKCPQEYKSKIDLISKSLRLKLDQLLNFLNNYYSTYLFNKDCYQSLFLVSVLYQINQKIDLIKKEKSIIHISEFNQIILKFLNQSSTNFIYEKTGHKYKNYFIDEFQDTSKLQWHNLIPLVEESLSSSGSCMIVGDGKQSIYRWRGGEVQQFLNLCDPNHPHSLKRFEHSIISLDVNYRSGSKIIGFNNLFFSFLSKNLVKKYGRLYEKLNQKPHSKKEGHIELSLINPNIEESIESRTLTKICTTIRDCQRDQYKLSDIVVLTRKNTDIIRIASHLVSNDIPVISSESLLLKSSKTVKFIINVLRIIVNSLDFSSRGEVLEYLVLEKKINISSTQLNKTIREKSTSSALEFENFLNKNNIPYSHNKYFRLNLYELVENIIRDFNLSKKNNLFITFFLDCVFDFLTKKPSSINAFLSYWEDNQNKISIVLPSGIDAVEIMTVHKSKGLEFPVVIFPFANWKQDVGKDKKWFDISGFFQSEEKNNQAITLLNLRRELEKWPGEFPAAYSDHKQEVYLDNINLLYVALTRAEDRMHIISNSDKNKGDIFSFFSDFIWDTYKIDLLKTEFIMGRKTKNPRKQIKSHRPIKTQFVSQPWRDRLSIRKRQNYYNDKSVIWGNLLHEIMSQVYTHLDLDVVLKRQKLNLKDYHSIYNQITSVINHQKIKHLFGPNSNSSFLELSILSTDGKVLRPDKVVAQSKKLASVIDYKTGKENKKHKDQMLQYEEVLLKMGFTKVVKYLVYFNNIKVIQF